MEIWKPIVGYEGYYEVSSLGRVKSLIWSKPIIIKTWISNRGRVMLRLKGKRFYVHRLVLYSFSGPCPHGMECAHLDGNPKNNKLTNLKWCTISENREHMKIHGTWLGGEKGPMVKLNNKKVLEIKKLINKGVSLKEIAHKYNMGITAIRYIKLGRRWSHITGIKRKREELKKEHE